MSGEGEERAVARQAEASSSGPTNTGIMSAVERLAALSTGGGHVGTSKAARKQRYAFWETQPVVQFDAATPEQVCNYEHLLSYKACLQDSCSAVKGLVAWCAGRNFRTPKGGLAHP